MTALRTVSYGGGVQSTALLVLAATDRIDFSVFLFANVGDDSEYPGTLDYLHEHAMPYAREHGIELHELHRTRRDGTTETLYGRLTRPGSRSLPIPVRMSNGAPGRRSCTADFKIRVLHRWCREHGATAEQPATVAVGISIDEFERAHNRREEPAERVVYPLLDLRLSRADCAQIIRRAGLPIPPKSACWFCPFHRPATWAEMRRDEPALFARSVDLERLLNERRALLGKDPVYLTRFNMPLDQAIGTAQDTLPFPTDDITCDNGMCWS
ncbi:phosphoadenosine phosphosulfate reductase [Cryptosporangium sp. NPDC051539]|uniref:phosphoadenosine phosphosulfate reductase n=1 Tax=Cryptosporangium sp. NPDC051539 TaxID=3363962 RepID=UPI0037B854E9